MTRWSRHDPVMMSFGCSDHWAKMRVMAVNSSGGSVQNNSFDVKDLDEIRRQKHERRMASRDAAYRTAPAAHVGDGRVDPVGNGVMGRVPMRDLHGNIPGNYASPNYGSASSTRSRPNSRSATFNNVYHQRAMSGNEYWYKERPKPTTFGRYGIGSYKTLLGLGNAPRT